MAESLLSLGIQYEHLPPIYVRPTSDRPKLNEVISEEIPLIDLGCDDISKIISQIGHACRNYGFFQMAYIHFLGRLDEEKITRVKSPVYTKIGRNLKEGEFHLIDPVTNHGISKELLQKMIEVAREFFHMPVEEKVKYYSEDPLKKIRLSTSSNVNKEKVRNWRDYLRLHCHPLEEFVNEWPSSPPSFKEVVSTYCKEVRELGSKLLEAISESLGLEGNYINTMLGDQGQHMAINYYPPCPEPELTFGLPAHTDPHSITILLPDQQVAGLQLLRNGKWIAFDPSPKALVINIGDQIQALSNGRYKSAWHRAIVNSNMERISVASFLCPEDRPVIGPAKKLTDDGTPPVYRSFTYDEYYKKFWSRSLDDEHCLELFKN